jgi:hypothetical protein
MSDDKTETAIAIANTLINNLLDGLVALVENNDEQVAKNVLADIENGPYATIDLVKYLKGGIRVFHPSVVETNYGDKN